MSYLVRLFGIEAYHELFPPGNTGWGGLRAFPDSPKQVELVRRLQMFSIERLDQYEYTLGAANKLTIERQEQERKKRQALLRQIRPARAVQTLEHARVVQPREQAAIERQEAAGFMNISGASARRSGPRTAADSQYDKGWGGTEPGGFGPRRERCTVPARVEQGSRAAAPRRIESS